MQGAQSKGLRIAAMTQGWDPTKFPDGSPALGGQRLDKPVFESSMGPLPSMQPEPNDGTFDQSVVGDKAAWNHPTDTSNKRDGYGGNDPFPGIPM